MSARVVHTRGPTRTFTSASGIEGSTQLPWVVGPQKPEPNLSGPDCTSTLPRTGIGNCIRGGGTRSAMWLVGVSATRA
jgi:hypothetical protein